MDWLMNLDLVSPVFVWTLRFLAIVTVVLVVAGWSQLARNTVRNVVFRVVALVAVAVLGILALAAPINAQYLWYPRLGDFFPQTGTVDSQQLGATAGTAVSAEKTSSPLVTGPRQRPADPFAGVTLKPTKSTAGAGYADFTVHGPRSGVTSQVTVWLPKEYRQNPHQEFPVIMALHGIEPAPYAYFNVVKLDQTIERLVAEHTMRPAIVVIPHWAVGGNDNECVDSRQGGKVETWLTQDVPQWVYDTFRVSPGRDSFAALGLSAGGWCGNMAAMLHPDTFATSISLGGYWEPIFDPPFIPFGKDSSEWRRYDLVALAQNNPPPVALWSLYGVSDSLAVPTGDRMIEAVHPPASLTQTTLTRGGHNTDVWLPYVPNSLEWLGAHSPAFAPR